MPGKTAGFYQKLPPCAFRPIWMKEHRESVLDLVANIDSPGATSFFRALSNREMAAHPMANDEETKTTLATKDDGLDEMTEESIGSAGHYFCYWLSWEFTNAVRTGFLDRDNTLKSLTEWRKIK